MMTLSDKRLTTDPDTIPEVKRNPFNLFELYPGSKNRKAPFKDINCCI